VGSKGLKHGNADRPSNRSKPLKLRRRVLNLIRKKYSGSEEERFGPTLAAEHLAEEDGIVLDHETLRLWMSQEGLWSRQRKRNKHCQRRERKSHFGELVQLDGSFHDWLEDRGPRGCLMDMVDDATNDTLARMGKKEETIWAAAGVLRAWIEKHGVPQTLYSTDWKNVYKRKATPAEQLRGKVPVTQFGRICQKLRRKKIASYEAANEYLEKEYLPEHNRRFARKAAKAEDYHGRKPTARELREILRLEAERRISNDWVIRHEGRYLQLHPAGQRRYGPTQSKALVCEWEDGAMEVYYRGQRLAYQELAEPLPRECEVDDRTKHSVAVPFFAKPRKPSQDHPWRRAYRGMKTSWSKKVEMPPRRIVARMEASL
jgi:PAS domain-containing protein